MKNEIPFDLYDIDRYYLDYLRDNGNPHVPKSDYEDEGKKRKFYCGPVYDASGVPMFVPVSHTPRDANGNGRYMKNLTCGRDQKAIGCLDFRFMVPCIEDHFVKHEVDLNAKTPLPDEKLTFSAMQARCVLNPKNQKNFEETAKQAFKDVTAEKCVAKSSIDFTKALDDVWGYEDYLEENKNKENYRYKPDPFIEQMKTRFQTTIDTITPSNDNYNHDNDGNNNDNPDP